MALFVKLTRTVIRRTPFAGEFASITQRRWKLVPVGDDELLVV